MSRWILCFFFLYSGSAFAMELVARGAQVLACEPLLLTRSVPLHLRLTEKAQALANEVGLREFLVEREFQNFYVTLKLNDQRIFKIPFWADEDPATVILGNSGLGDLAEITNVRGVSQPQHLFLNDLSAAELAERKLEPLLGLATALVMPVAFPNDAKVQIRVLGQTWSQNRFRSPLQHAISKMTPGALRAQPQRLLPLLPVVGILRDLGYSQLIAGPELVPIKRGLNPEDQMLAGRDFFYEMNFKEAPVKFSPRLVKGPGGA